VQLIEEKNLDAGNRMVDMPVSGIKLGSINIHRKKGRPNSKDCSNAVQYRH